jgi:hypothetical protein
MSQADTPPAAPPIPPHGPVVFQAPSGGWSREAYRDAIQAFARARGRAPQTITIAFRVFSPFRQSTYHNIPCSVDRSQRIHVPSGPACREKNWPTGESFPVVAPFGLVTTGPRESSRRRELSAALATAIVEREAERGVKHRPGYVG